VKRKYYLLIVLCALLAGFVAGWQTSRRLKVFANAETQKSYLREPRDATDPVRAEILSSWQEFQDGYSKRNPKELDAFIKRLFPQEQDTRLLGTDEGEWKIGHDSIAEFIRDDWIETGDVRLEVKNAVVSSSSETGWLATTGSVTFLKSSRPIRFTAVLTRTGGRWLFRQVQFQWDERLERFSDLFRIAS
jgi:SnoaL-like domain